MGHAFDYLRTRSWSVSWRLVLDRVAALLREKGHLVETPDLPGHGTDKTPIQEVTLQSCVDKVCNIIETHSIPVILVGIV